MKTILITGATSFIGVHVIQEYLDQGCHVIAVARKNSQNLCRLPNSRLLTIVELDMKDIGELVFMKGVIEGIPSCEIDVFYHLAWDGARAPWREDAKLQQENFNWAVKAMEVARQLGCKTFIGAGSQAEYGKCVGEIHEDYPENPITEYGKAKLKACETVREMARECGIHFVWTRIFSVYGVYDNQGTLVMMALDKMKKNERVPLTQCTQSWDFVYVSDVARAMRLLADSSCPEGVYNIASGEGRQLKDFVLEMKEICKSTSELQFGAIPYQSEGVVSFQPVVAKLKQSTGWTCEVGFEEGIRKILKYQG